MKRGISNESVGWVIATMFALTMAGASFLSLETDVPPLPPYTERASQEKSLLYQTNQERAEPISIDPYLQSMSESRAAYLCYHPFEHSGWQDSFDRTDYTRIGENIARNYWDATSTNEALMASLDHRKNIEDPEFRDAGIAYVACTDSSYGTVTSVVELFGGYN